MRIQNLCKEGQPRFLPTSRSRVAAAAKIWASEWGSRSAPALMVGVGGDEGDPEVGGVMRGNFVSHIF